MQSGPLIHEEDTVLLVIPIIEPWDGCQTILGFYIRKAVSL